MSSHYMVSRPGEYRHTPVVETTTTRWCREHDHTVANEILAADGQLNDLELLARMYTATRDDGSHTPIFPADEIGKLGDLVGLPIFVEHSYPAGIKLPSKPQLGKNLYPKGPMPQSVPLGRVVKTYPNAAPGELWARLRIDPAGLTGEELRRLRDWLRNTLVEMSLGYGVTTEPRLLVDGLGRKYHGPVLRRTDGQYGRCVEASLTHRGDIAGCNVVMVRASADDGLAVSALYGTPQSSPTIYNSGGKQGFA